MRNQPADSLHRTASGDLFIFSNGALYNSSGTKLAAPPPHSQCACVNGSTVTFVTRKGQVLLFTENGGFEEREILFPPDHHGKYRVIPGKSGFFCLQDLSDYTIRLYNGSGKPAGPVITGTNDLYSEIRTPTSAIKNKDGKILIADRELCRICVFSPDGEPLGRLKRNQILPADLVIHRDTGILLVLVSPGYTIDPPLVEIYSSEHRFLGYLSAESTGVLRRAQEPLYAPSHQHPHDRIPHVSVPENKFCSLVLDNTKIYLGGRDGVVSYPFSIRNFLTGEKTDGPVRRVKEHSIKLNGSGDFGVTVDGPADHINTEYAGRVRTNAHISPPGFQPTEEITISNEGDSTITNPWLRNLMDPDWFSTNRLVKSIMPEGIGDREKALRLWRFMCRYTRHGAAQHNYYWDVNKSVIRFFNSNGAGSCGTHPYFTALCRAAGLPAGDGFASVLEHVLAKVRYDGKDHYFDDILSPNEHDPAYGQGFSRSMTSCRRGSFPPALDNMTVASPEELIKDPYLLFRLNRLPHPIHRHLCYLRTVTKPNDWHPVTADYTDPADMEMKLRPGEQIVFRTCFMGKHLGTYWPPDNVVSGELRYIPRINHFLDSGMFRKVRNLELITVGKETVLQTADFNRPAVIEVDVYCPWGITGGRIGGSFELSGGIMDIFIRPGGGEMRKIGSTAGDGITDFYPCFDKIGELEHTGSFDPSSGLLRNGPPIQKFTARYVITASGKRVKPRIHHIKIETDFQINSVSIPLLRRGLNRYVYSQDGDDPSAKISFRWVEAGSKIPPPKPSRPVFPANAGKAETPEFRFRWEMPDGISGGEIYDYEFFLSDQNDFAYPAAPCFETFTGNGNQELANPGSVFLNPGKKYFWKVRALGREGIWGDWSDPWHFIYTGVGKPVFDGIEIDGEKISISWKAGEGKLPVKYEVFGSNEQGFIPSPESFPIARAMESRETTEYPENKAGTVSGLSLQVAGPNCSGTGLNRVYYRITALDGEGGRSCPSECVELPFPFVYSVPPVAVFAGQPYFYQIKALYRSPEIEYTGEIKKIMEYRTDTIRYRLLTGPEWISLDEKNGILSGIPEKHKSGEEIIRVHIETVRLLDGKITGTCVHSFTLKMPDPSTGSGLPGC